MRSLNASEREIVAGDDTDKTDFDASQVEKDYPKESAEALQPSLDKIPDGGIFAWLQVAGAFCIFFNTWFVNIFIVRLFMPSAFRLLTVIPKRLGA